MDILTLGLFFILLFAEDKLKIIVIAHPHASKNFVEVRFNHFDEKEYHVYTQKPSNDGEANKAILGLLADYLQLKIYQLKIIRGTTTKKKIIEIN